jgi:co-chaperonin GroES (HSP10)
MRPIRSHVIVEVDKQFNDTVKMDSGVELFIDTTWEPAQHIRIHGTVITPPMYGNSIYSIENQYIVPEVEAGDKIYFHYNVLMSKSNHIEGNLWFVPYFQIFCAVRNGEIKMVGSYILVEPITTRTESEGMIIIPTAYQKKKEHKYGILRHIGTPNTDQPTLPVEAGDIVFFSEMDCFENNIEGTTYYCMLQEDLHMYTKPQKETI